jgi:SnoaL-like domain
MAGSTLAELASSYERAEVTQVCVRSAWLADRRDWAGFGDLFAAEVDLDYTSLHGGTPQRLSRDALVIGWRTALGGLSASQHLVANHVVALDGDSAECTAAVQATHVLITGDIPVTWTVGGHYRYVLSRHERSWRIRGLTLTAEWTTGDRAIMAAAVQNTLPDCANLVEEWNSGRA